MDLVEPKILSFGQDLNSKYSVLTCLLLTHLELCEKIFNEKILIVLYGV